LAIRLPQIIKFGGDLTKFWPKNLRHFLAHSVSCK